MVGRQVALYFAWSRADEISAPLGTLENRFPALFEFRRMLWPGYEQFSDPDQFDQGIAGFLDNVLLANFAMFGDLARSLTGNSVRSAQRRTESAEVPLSDEFLAGVDTLIVISFDSRRTEQQAGREEITAVRTFLDNPSHSLFVCPHHDIGDVEELPKDRTLARQEAEFFHHGDHTIPPQQRFGGFGLSLLAGLGLPVRNRFGLHPAKAADGSPAPIEVDELADRFKLLKGVKTFNLHPHLPHFETLGNSEQKFDVLARQAIDLNAPPHPFVQAGRRTFDAMLQTKAEVFAGGLIVCDATIWSSTAGGVDSLQQFWRNVIELR